MDPTREHISETNVICPGCGYNLTGMVIGAKCPECGTPVEHALRIQPQGPPLPRVDYVVPVLLTVLCCVIGGIAAVVYTSKANTAAELGDVARYNSAKSSRTGWMVATLVLGLIVLGVQFLPLLVA